MLTIIQTFWQIALLRLGPENLPDSRFLFSIALTAYLLLNGLVVMVLYPADSLLPVLLADLVLLLGWCGGLLLVCGHLSRLTRVLTALLGAGAILQLLAMPVNVFPSADGPGLLQMLVLLLILLWSIAVHGHVLSRGLSIHFGFGVFLATVYLVLNFELLAWLRPAA